MDDPPTWINELKLVIDNVDDNMFIAKKHLKKGKQKSKYLNVLIKLNFMYECRIELEYQTQESQKQPGRVRYEAPVKHLMKHLLASHRKSTVKKDYKKTMVC